MKDQKGNKHYKRSSISRSEKILQGVKIKLRKLSKMKKKYLPDNLTSLKETLKQEIQLKVQRIRRYKKKRALNSTDKTSRHL